MAEAHALVLMEVSTKLVQPMRLAVGLPAMVVYQELAARTLVNGASAR